MGKQTLHLVYVFLFQLAVENPGPQEMLLLCSSIVQKWVQRSPTSAVLALFQELLKCPSVLRI